MMTFEEQLAAALTFKPFEAKKEMNYTVLKWTDETRDKIYPGVVVRYKDGKVELIGHCNDEEE